MLPGVEASSWHGGVTPAKTPCDIKLALHKATVSALPQPDLEKRRRDLVYTIIGDRSDVYAEFIRADIDKWRAIVKQRGISAD